MKKISRFVMVALLMTSLLILQNCGPKGDGCEDHDPVKTYYHISEADKSKIPFTGTDTLVYISTDGDTATLYGQGKKEFTEKVAEKWDPDPGCSTYDYNYFDNIEFVYQGNNHELNTIFIDFNAGVYSPTQTNADFTIVSKKYSGYLGYVSNELNYKDSIILSDNKIYYGIDAGIFYNYHYGLLKVLASNKTWLLNLRK